MKRGFRIGCLSNGKGSTNPDWPSGYSGAQIAKRQVEELAVRAAQDFDAFYEQRAPKHAPTAELLILSTDGKGIVMRHEDLRAATRAAPRLKRVKRSIFLQNLSAAEEPHPTK